MRVLFPILLIALVGGYWACNRNTKATPETKSPELTEREKMKKGYENSTVSADFVKADPKPQMKLNPEDSAELYVIDDYVRLIESERGKKYKRTDLQQPIFSTKDHLFYTTDGNKVIESIVIIKDGDDQERYYFYFKDSFKVFYRHLEIFNSGLLPFARETIVFFKEDEIFEVQQRKLDLHVGENPNKLLIQPFTRPDVDMNIVKQDIDKIWAKMFTAIENHELGLN